MQPYANGKSVVDPSTAGVVNDGKGNDEALSPVFNPYGLDRRKDLMKPGFQKTLYTAINGFLKLRTPLGVDNQGAKDEK